MNTKMNDTMRRKLIQASLAGGGLGGLGALGAPQFAFAQTPPHAADN